MVEPCDRPDQRVAAEPVGVLMLDTAFERFPRDIGHAGSLPFTTLHERVAGATVNRVVRGERLSRERRAAFASAARTLIDRGAGLIATSCGFLYREQAMLTREVAVPVVSSALLALPRLRERYGPNATIGVLTFDRDALGDLDPPSGGGRTAIVGLPPDSHFRAWIEGRCDEVDPAHLARDVAQAACRLADVRPAAVVLECTNLAPFRAEVERACGVEVIDLVDEIERALSSGSR